MNNKSHYFDIPASYKLLVLFSKLIPTDYLKTFFYLNAIYRPRKMLRTIINSFYRYDHVYETIRAFTKRYKGNFSVIEFGVAAGYSFTKILYATKYLGVDDRITVHGFDSFEGMPPSCQPADLDCVTGDSYCEGQFKSSYTDLNEYCKKHYTNYRLHKGWFNESITSSFLDELRAVPPILIWIDCDYYSSSLCIMQRLHPYIPNGCVIYFDEPEFNYGSVQTGESRLIHEINQGRLGTNIELALDTSLSLNTKRVYRFINSKNAPVYSPYKKINKPDSVNLHANDSPLP